MSAGLPRVGISSCLLGEAVRYDGTDKASVFDATAFEGLVEWVPVCPEVEAGLGVPREPIELVRDGDHTLLLGMTSRTDHTDRMRSFAARRVERLAALGLHGYVLKARSPSCGPHGVPVAGSAETRAGVFADALIRRFPGLPMAHEEELAEPGARARFIQRLNAAFVRQQ